jgi:hypothetical protein
MKNSFVFGTVVSALLAVPLLVSAPARAASISDCGNIDIDASATCTVEVNGGCTVMCTPVNFEAACAAKLDVMCDASCNASLDASCTASCDTDCEAQCSVNPPEFDCAASCKLDGSAQCEAECSSSANKTECAASCKAHFAAQCDAKCTGTPPSANCTAKCSAKCKGSCTASANLSCQIDCQKPTLYASCEATLSGGCTADCKAPSGALFCDGSYVDHNGAVKDCIDAIENALPTVTVDTSATGNASCDDAGTCQATGDASASASCAFSPIGSARGANVAGGFALFAALGAVCFRRRKSR